MGQVGRPVPFLFLAAASAVLLGACGGDEGSGVTMSGHAFEPVTLEISAGETVSWTNDTGEAHTVTGIESSIPEGADYFASGSFPSEEEARDDLAGGLITAGDTYEFTFTKPGTYRYVCLPHEGDGMRGEVVVEEGG